MFKFLTILLFLLFAVAPAAQTVNEAYIWKKVEEARLKHRASQTNPATEKNTEIQRQREQRETRAREYVESQRESNEQIRKNINDAKTWTIDDMRSRHSPGSRGNYTQVEAPATQTTSVNAGTARQSTDFATLISDIENLDVTPSGTFYSNEELRQRLKSPFCVDSSIASECKESSLISRAWDFIDMDYTDYLNSDRRSLPEDVARKYYSELRIIYIDAYEKSADGVSKFISILQSDWGELYESKRIQLKTQFIRKLPTRIKKMSGGISSSATDVAGGIEVKRIIFTEQADIMRVLISGSGAKEMVDAVECGQGFNVVDKKLSDTDIRVRKLAKNVVEKETGMKVAVIPASNEETIDLIRQHTGIPKTKDYARTQLGNMFGAQLRKHAEETIPDFVEHYDTYQQILK